METRFDRDTQVRALAGCVEPDRAARMRQGDRVLALALGAFSKPRSGPSFDLAPRPDAPLMAAFTDAWPPACFALLRAGEPVTPVPTVDLTIHFRRDLPLAGATPEHYYLAVFRSRFSEQGFVEEDGEVWSRDGVLLAQSRQLAVMG